MNDYYRHSFLTFGGQIFSLILILLSNILITRVLGPEGKGIMSLLLAFPILTVMISLLGLDEAIVYFLGGKKFEYSEVLGWSILNTLIVSAISIGVFLILRNWLVTTVIKNISSEFLMIAIFCIPFQIFFQYECAILLGQKNIFGYNLLAVSRNFLLLLAQVVLILKFGLRGGVYAILIGFATSPLFGLLLIKKFGKPKIPKQFSYERKSISYGVRSVLGLLFHYLTRRLDIFIINFFLSPVQVGFYAIAIMLAELPWYIPSAFGTVLFPEVSGMDKEQANKFSATVCRNTVFITAVASLLLALFAKPIIGIFFSARFYPSLIPFYLHLPGTLALGITRVLGGNFQGTGRPEFGTLMALVSFLVTVILDILLIPRLGINGAAIAATIANTFSAGIGLYIFLKSSKIRFSEMLFARLDEVKNYRQLVTRILKR
ncbi:MAG: oligosaccharide flippase family protein [candidate division WOR-3 bacterium]|nr:oligosaccharide flippase family protein [candidate division WOR-3 bacterium]